MFIKCYQSTYLLPYCLLSGTDLILHILQIVT
jgi:hypothetical protein